MNGLATNQKDLTDEMYENENLHDESGNWQLFLFVLTSFSSSFAFVAIGYPIVWIVTTLVMAVYWLRYSKFLFKAEDYISNRNLI